MYTRVVVFLGFCVAPNLSAMVCRKEVTKRSEVKFCRTSVMPLNRLVDNSVPISNRILFCTYLKGIIRYTDKKIPKIVRRNFYTKWDDINIFHCTRTNKVDDLRKAVMCVRDVAPQDYRGKTPLHYALEMGYMEAAEALMEGIKPCQVNKQDENGDTVLHLAAREGRKKLVIQLLKMGANSDIRNDDNFNPFLEADWCEHYDIARCIKKYRSTKNHLTEQHVQQQPQDQWYKEVNIPENMIPQERDLSATLQ